MLKIRYFVIFAIILIASFFTSKNVSAQTCNPVTGENCFRCEWQGIPDNCEPAHDACPYCCIPGYDYDKGLCDTYDNDQVGCAHQVNLSCINPNPANCYFCDNFMCYPAQQGDPRCEYENATDCQNVCMGRVRYCECNQNTYLCELRPTPSPGSILCLECEGECKKPVEDCTGFTTGLPGGCYFLTCPEFMPWDGINIPTSLPIGPGYPTTWPRPGEYQQCADNFPYYGFSCCLLVTPTIIPMPTIEPVCTTSNGESGIYTAVGCIPISSQNSFLTFILPWALGVGGGTAFILIIVGGFLFMTSGGNPQRVKAAKELLTSAVIGLLLIIFSVYILNLIGVRILNLPGL